eukprot:c15012_g1_i4.p1 GENE.c15012_g1_i4~~c15012_g1_i4.p1  ORF type:complete len:126 (+),score=35.46 c15012_g1_i4:20-397(+)
MKGTQNSPQKQTQIYQSIVQFDREKAGLIFGRKGKTLNGLKKSTGAKILVNVENGEIHISATSERIVKRAQLSIQEILAVADTHRLIYLNITFSSLTDISICFIPFANQPNQFIIVYSSTEIENV